MSRGGGYGYDHHWLCEGCNAGMHQLPDRCLCGAPRPSKPVPVSFKATHESDPEVGRKFDGEKDRWDLLPTVAVRAIVRVLTLGVQTKYAAWNWVHVRGAKRRYYSALNRHLNAWWEGETLDVGTPEHPGTGEHHLACAGCCLLFLLAFELDPSLEYPPEDEGK